MKRMNLKSYLSFNKAYKKPVKIEGEEGEYMKICEGLWIPHKNRKSMLKYFLYFRDGI